MAASREPTAHRAALFLAGAAAVVTFGWVLPLFRIVPLNSPAAAAAPATFDAAAVAAKIWQTELPAAARRALELKTLAGPLRENPGTARAKFARTAGVGAAYYFVRGAGTVVARERNYLRVAVDGAAPAVVALRIGPVFGNTVRDGCGLLEVNAFPGLQEFNALAAELDALVEKQVLPPLRAQAKVGAAVRFAGCAEAPESAAGADEPLLTIVPVQAEVR